MTKEQLLADLQRSIDRLNYHMTEMYQYAEEDSVDSKEEIYKRVCEVNYDAVKQLTLVFDKARYIVSKIGETNTK